MPFRYFGAFRFLLALLVVFHHYGLRFGGPSLKAIDAALLPGTPAVLVFYALSGFVLLEAAVSTYFARPIPFITNRVMRIVPPFWAALTLMLAFLWIFQIGIDAGGKPMPPAAFAGQNILVNYLSFWPGSLPPLRYGIAFDFIPVFWSVRFEIVFYLALFGLLLAVRKSPAGFKWTTISLAMAATLASFADRLIETGPWGGYNSVPWPFFALGLLGFWAETIPRRIALPLIAVTACVALDGFRYLRPVHRADPLQTALLIALLLLAWWLSRAKLPPSFRTADGLLGDLSYSIYLTHVVVQVAMLHLHVGPSDGLLALCVGVSISLAVAFYLVVDRPMKAVRSFIRRSRPTRQSSSGPPSGLLMRVSARQT